MPRRTPTVPQRRLAAELRRLREAAGLTMEQVAAALPCSISKISRIETAHIGVSPRDVGDLLTLYGIHGEERDPLVLLAQEAQQKTWWQQEYRDLPAMALVGFESEATSLRQYDTVLIPGLLQTMAYTRAVLSAIRPDARPEDIERRLKLRMNRQALLREQAPLYRVVLDEAAVRRCVGGPKVMYEQLQYLGEVAANPNVTVQILPFSSGEHAGMDGGFTILHLSESGDPDVVYVENMGRDLYLDDPGVVQRYETTFERLQVMALSATDSAAFLAKVAQDLELG